MSESQYFEALARYDELKDVTEGKDLEEKLWLAWAIKRYKTAHPHLKLETK